MKVQTQGASLRPQTQNRAAHGRPGPLALAPLGLARLALEVKTHRLRPEGLCLGSQCRRNPGLGYGLQTRCGL